MDLQLKENVLPLAERFQALVEVRNSIMHGKPGTAPGGDQRLFHHGRQWTKALVDSAADDFTECSSKINDLLYGVLAAQ